MARAAWSVALVVLVCGCAALPPPGSAASSARENPPDQVASAPRITAPPLYTPPASSARVNPAPPPAGTTCRIPFSEISEASGGFILYPSGRRQDDPASVVALPGNQPGAIGMNPGLTYDWAVGKWVPVPLKWLAPNGQTYAYAWQGRIRAVTVATGESGDVTTSGNWELVGVADDGVYAAQPSTPGVWFIPFGQAPRKVLDQGSWISYSGGALWGTDSTYQLLRYDLTTHEQTTWGTIARVAGIAGFDAAGEPVISAGGALSILHNNGTSTTVWPGTNGLSSGGWVFGDVYGLWFEVWGSSGIVGAPGSGIYLWTPGGGARQVSMEAVHPMGPCV